MTGLMQKKELKELIKCNHEVHQVEPSKDLNKGGGLKPQGFIIITSLIMN